jgi:hypothetical protein
MRQGSNLLSTCSSVATLCEDHPLTREADDLHAPIEPTRDATAGSATQAPVDLETTIEPSEDVPHVGNVAATSPLATTVDTAESVTPSRLAVTSGDSAYLATPKHCAQ